MQTLQKKSLFWDVRNIDPRKNARFVIERIFNFGDEKDLKWALDYYDRKKLVDSLLESRSLEKKSLDFWCRYFNISKQKCLSKQSTKKQSAFSKR